MEVYNARGQEVAALVSAEMSPGSYEVPWDASRFASGVYLYRLQAGDPSTRSGQWFVETKKLLLLK